ncbi:hypothetical protein L593_05550 [Salinarchaeum sp. Harcht-Bsk1]|uniref:hypothetical protein n=1 Tax=Salinarchaeum sp. Harcht-Bsk1 TaxID=1333523 RepID=UPI00034235A1|nr:hypothetical protein [Salinarchaeum sp. Harcht-Bsk1]AGN01059.1 hypothetical protein L593_05550 [Salinarchaeum sp. Harcht-Bsk1]
MEQTIPTSGYKSSVTDHRSIGGTIVFVAVLAALLLAAAYPALATATALGAISAHVLGTAIAARRRHKRRYAA